MPAELFFEIDDLDLDKEMVRWANEYQLRTAGFNGRESREAEHIAKKLNGNTHTVKQLQAVEDRVKEMQKGEYATDRLPMLHTTSQNITAVEKKGKLPDGFLDDLHEAAADYINGFMPGQEIAPPENTAIDETDKKYSGTHNFRRDKSTLYRKFGSVDNGTPAAEVAAHETMHKNNVEALIGDEADTVRQLATIYHHNVPLEYEKIIEETDVPLVKHDIMGGLSLLVLDEIYGAGVLDAYQENRRHEIDLMDYTEEFENAAEVMNQKFGVENFDVRDETICQAVTYFMKGQFEQGFENHLTDTRTAYNNLSQYQSNAGDKIARNLEALRTEMEEAEGLRGQRFKQVMQNRIPFLQGDYEFGA